MATGSDLFKIVKLKFQKGLGFCHWAMHGEMTQLSEETSRVHVMHDSTLSLYNSVRVMLDAALRVWETACLQLPKRFDFLF